MVCTCCFLHENTILWIQGIEKFVSAFVAAIADAASFLPLSLFFLTIKLTKDIAFSLLLFLFALKTKLIKDTTYRLKECNLYLSLTYILKQNQHLLNKPHFPSIHMQLYSISKRSNFLHIEKSQISIENIVIKGII